MSGLCSNNLLSMCEGTAAPAPTPPGPGPGVQGNPPSLPLPSLPPPPPPPLPPLMGRSGWSGPNAQKTVRLSAGSVL